MKRTYILAILGAALLGGLLFYLYAGHQAPPGQPPLATLTPRNFTSLETAFNAAKDDVRVLLLLSPT
ncbi:MAG TPA: hypothetical protein VN893_02155 [Bryobacteraceae bacterium]|nr:hypothetical protein [Bryobacteraceae bacterium]